MAGKDDAEVTPDFLIELEGELWRANVIKQLTEMKAIRYHDGPFRAGWECAIEEIETRLEIENG